MKKFLTVLIMGFLLFLSDISAEELIFATTSWPPYVIVEDDKISGRDVDIVREACKRNNIQPDIQIVPWKRALKYAEEGTSHAMFTPQKTKERSEFLCFPSESLNKEKIVIVAIKGSNIKADSLKELKDMGILIVRGYVYSPELDNDKDLYKYECDDDRQIIVMLKNRRLPLGAGDEGVMKFLARQNNIQIETIYVLSEVPSYVAFSKKALGEKGKVLAEKFSETLRRLKEEGFVRKVESKYFE